MAKKKKKKKEKSGTGKAELDARGAERPRFLLAFPPDPELERLASAFEAGDFATVRSDAPALADRTDDPRVRDAALELERRTEPDPLIRYILIASVVLLAFLVIYAYTHKH